MPRILFRQAGVALTILLALAATAKARARSDPYFGEALYYAYQQRWFDALERLDTEIAQHDRVDERELDSLHPLIGHAEFSIGDFELSFRMHQRAGRAIRAVLDADVADPVRNDAAYRLAKLELQKERPGAALDVLGELRGELSESLRDAVAYLRANALLATGRASQATDVLREIQGSPQLGGFAAYNLGIALLRDGRASDALAQLDRSGTRTASGSEAVAMRDKSNLVLGSLQLEAGNFDAAQRSLDRVRLSGPFANQALLRAGWADVSAGRFDRALVPWQLLVERDPTDLAVQEAWLALPYAYGKLDIHGRAALLYGRAVDSLDAELAKVDASIRHIEDGALLEALVREEIRQDADWVIRLRSLPNAPETFYLIGLIASHGFQTALQNFLDLDDLRRRLRAGERSLGAYEDLIRLRSAYYEPILPAIDRRFRELDARVRLRLEQRDQLDARLQQLLVAPRPALLATAAEQRAAARLEQHAARVQTLAGPRADAARARIARLRGALLWALETEYPERLTAAHRHLRELETEIDALRARYDAFVHARQAASHGYQGYEAKIGALRARIAGSLERVQVLMKHQGEQLENVAIEELVARREQLEKQQNQARFAFADSYDRAAKAQLSAQAR